MRKLMLLALIGLNLPAQASDWFDTQKPVTCGPFREIVQNLTQEKYREAPIWIGQSSVDTTQFSLFVNKDTGGWTLIQYARVTGCVIGVGQSHRMIDPARFKESQ
jgi:hypothetical protein